MSYPADLNAFRTDIIIDQSWLAASGARAVMAALNPDDGAARALFVGGCVRDAILERPVTDIDIATVHAPAETIRLLERAGLRAVPTGIAYGTITAVADGQGFQVTTLRRDVETFGRRAVVAFTDDWREDAARRDFTINTLLAGRDGRVYDPLGGGLTDLHQGRVRFVGDAATRIAEDTLRILRFFRFHASCGAGALDPDALAACRAQADRIPDLSRERITQEFLRILSVDKAVDTLKTMFDCNVLSDIVHSEYKATDLARLIDFEKRHARIGHLSRLAVLSGYNPDHLPTLAKYLLLPTREIAALQQILGALKTLPALTEQSVRQLIFKTNNDIAERILFLAAVRAGAPVDTGFLEIVRNWCAPVLPISGTDLMTLGVEQGPVLGDILDAVRSWWMEEDFRPDHADCLDYARRFIKKKI